MRILHAGTPSVPEWAAIAQELAALASKSQTFLITYSQGLEPFTMSYNIAKSMQDPLAEKFCMLEQPTLSITMHSRTRCMPSVISATATSNSPWWHRSRNLQYKHDKDLPIVGL